MKKFLCIIMALLMTLSAVSLTACAPETDETPAPETNPWENTISVSWDGFCSYAEIVTVYANLHTHGWGEIDFDMTISLNGRECGPHDLLVVGETYSVMFVMSNEGLDFTWAEKLDDINWEAPGATLTDSYVDEEGRGVVVFDLVIPEVEETLYIDMAVPHDGDTVEQINDTLSITLSDGTELAIANEAPEWSEVMGDGSDITTFVAGHTYFVNIGIVVESIGWDDALWGIVPTPMNIHRPEGYMVSYVEGYQVMIKHVVLSVTVPEPGTPDPGFPDETTTPAAPATPSTPAAPATPPESQSEPPAVHEHRYTDHAVDYGRQGHRLYCACGEYIEEEHSNNGVLQGSGVMGHTYGCPVCGGEYFAGHTWNDRATCAVCGFHEHHYTYTVISNTEHSYSCPCGETGTEEHDAIGNNGHCRQCDALIIN